jgi:hypothetical protein
MDSETEKYSHRPVTGLPKSALAITGQGIAVIALMQQKAALNRELRRELQAAPTMVSVTEDVLSKKVSKHEWNLLTHFLSSGERFGSFWYVRKRTQQPLGKLGARAYAVAVDVQLLDAYDPDWKNLVLDEAALVARCAEWPAIRDRVEKHAKFQKGKVPLGVFMLWPRICDELARWADLDADRRITVAQAVFALSSIGWSQWFIDQAVTQYPELEGELGHLIRRRDQEASAPEAAPAGGNGDKESATTKGSKSRPIDGPELKWLSIGERLMALTKDWPQQPAKDPLEVLASLGAEATELIEMIPDEGSRAQALYEDALEALREHLSRRMGNDASAKLGPEDVDAIMARWRIAREACLDDSTVHRLAADAHSALERLTTAFSEVQATETRFEQTREEVARLEQQLASQPSARLRIELTNQQLLAKEDAIAAQRKAADATLFLMSSASPWGESFDPAVDYSAQSVAREREGKDNPQDGHGTDGPFEAAEVASDSDLAEIVRQSFGPRQGEEESARADSLSADVDVQRAGSPATADQGGSTLDKPLTVARPPMTGSDQGSAAQSTSESPTELRGALAGAQAQQGGAPPSEQNFFNPDAGELCRPIWALLHTGKPALAYQFAEALAKSHENLIVPYPALLQSVVLASGVVTSDGPLAMTIGEALGRLKPAWFDPVNAPSNWHTAINILLIAATLRPMVLAPASNAAAVARYRHLDGRHAGLLELVLQSVADGVSQKTQLVKLSNRAEDWLVERAPNKKIRYAPASQVWLQWLKPGEAIHKLMDPVVRGSLAERSSVRSAIEELSDHHLFLERVKDTDRRQLQRRGQEIHAGALEHLWTATREAVALAKEWLGAANLQGGTGGRLPAAVEQLKSAFQDHAEQACAELEQVWDDEWGQVQAASCVLRAEVEALAGMFKEGDALPAIEAPAAELLAEDLLWVPQISLAHGWEVDSGTDELLAALKAWSISPLDADGAMQGRLKRGDLAGAELLLERLPRAGDEKHHIAIDKARELWIKDLQRHVQEARRASEVGLAYGYLSDAERADFESDISAVEAAMRETDRFDRAVERLNLVKTRIEEQKAKRVDEARRELEREQVGLSEDVARQLSAPLVKSDIHTFNELLQRVRQGAEPWPEKETRRDVFADFFPELQGEILNELSGLDAATVDKAIGSGGRIGSLSFDLEGDKEARSAAEECYRAWATSSTRRNMSRESLRKVLDALGLHARSLDQDRSGQGWILQTTPIDDREICPVPHFGSRAQGRYRILVLTERLTPEDLLRRVGDSTQQTATVVLYLARPPARFWTDLARLSKERQRSFLLLDESMLLFLLAESGSRLASWFSIALPFTYSEPYDASAGFVPSEMFYGRASELESVKAQGGCYFIYGGRQLGKTALLRRAERTFMDPAADQYAVWLDLLAQGIGERRPASDVWVSLADKLRELKIAGLDLPAVNSAKPASVDAMLAALKAFLAAKPGRRLLVLLDEADRFFEQDGRQGAGYAETRRLKQLMDETERRFKVVFAGLHNVLRTATTSNQPLGHLNEAVRVGPLMDEREIRAAEELITRPVEAAGFEFEDRSLVMRVLAQTNYYPSLIQLYCTQLLRHAREHKLRRDGASGPRFRIEEADIESVFSGRPLRDAIRSKFRLTLQLDDRYEVIANAIGLEALATGFDHAHGIEWRKIRQDCATWWPEGFATTSERDFLVLLEEMVQLGVLSEAKSADRFSLRNPNVLLLLGSKQEIENTLQAEREPRIEFESTIFRPSLSGRIDNPARNPLTYRQLDEVVQTRSSVLLVAATEASGGTNLLAGLRDHPGSADGRLFVLLENLSDKKGFVQELDRQFKKRVSEGVTVMLVPAAVPWTGDWFTAARAKVSALKSATSFVSVVFHADTQRLWELTGSSGTNLVDEAWLSVLPWARGFVRKWLEELQLPVDCVDRLRALTGYWGGLLESVAQSNRGALDFAHNLDRISNLLRDAGWRKHNTELLTGGIEPAEKVLRVMHGLGDGVTEDDLVEFGELPRDLVQQTLRWADRLGLAGPDSGSAWSMNPFLKQLLEDLPQ